MKPDKSSATPVVDAADVIVLGMGPGGEEVAGRLAEAGLDVVGIESNLVGGECPYWGCVPSKMMIRAADLLAEGRRIPGMAGTSSISPDWHIVAGRIRSEATDGWNDQVAVKRFESLGGRFVRGRGRIIGPAQVEVDGQIIEARRGIVIATGSRPVIPPVPGLSDVSYWTNREAIETEEIPDSLIVLGGGAIGVELAQVFARFGSEVTVVEGLDRILPFEEPEASEVVSVVLTREGLKVLTGFRAERVRQESADISVTLSSGNTILAQRLLVTTGRRADLSAVGVAAVGLDEEAGSIRTDDRLRAAPGVWAVGDVTEFGGFTHMAMYQARIVIADILGVDHPPARYGARPRVTFTDPEVGAVGLTESDATASGLSVRIGKACLSSSARGWIHKSGNDGLIKLVEDADRGVLVGGTSVGPAGGEVLGLLALAVHAQVPVEELRQMIYAYPTFHRAIETALDDLRRPAVGE